MRSRFRQSAARCCGVFLVCASACSFTSVKGPPKERPLNEDLDCTESNVSPGTDVGVAALGAAATIFGVAVATSCHSNEMMGCLSDGMAGGAVAVIGGILALTHGASAVYGYAKTSRCHDAMACTRGDRILCEKLGWSPPPSPPARRPPSDSPVDPL